MKTRTRFLLLFFLAGVLSVVLYIYALGPVTRFYVQHIDSQSLSAGDLESILRRASSEITLSPGRSGFIAQAARAVRNHHPGTDGVYIQVLDSEGRVLYSNPGQDSLGPEKIRSLLASGLRFDRYTVGELGGLFTGAIEYGRFIAEAAAVPLSNEDPDAGTLVGALEFSQTTGFSLALRGEGYNLLLIAFVVGLVCVFVVTLLVIFLGTISLLRRFERLNTGLKEVLSGNYHFRLPEKGRDELASISSSFNIMITGLAKQEEERQRMEQEKRRIITSLSHDLRTPLTSVMGYA
ncbi:MAG: HAMP domain-containing protein, partial [Spirochaetia bacterium]